MTYTPRRLRPFDWHMCIIKLIGAPIVGFAITIVLIGFGGDAGMLDSTMENGQVVREWNPGSRDQAADARCKMMRADAADLNAPTNAWATHLLAEGECK